MTERRGITTMHVVGLDIGGANIKGSDGDARSVSREFELWRRPGELAGALTEVVAAFERFDLLAVTMTGELADCFATKAEGVDAILRAAERAAAGRPVFVWQTGAEFVPSDVAREIPRLVAAANWHALATWVGRMVPAGVAILLDIGSTTTDIIPLLDGVPVPTGLTDVERLQSGELVYSGVRRTPLCAIAHSVPFRGRYCPLAAELFATTLDAYLLLGDIAEEADDGNTANGRPATVAAAHDRLARMLCCDRSEVTLEEARGVARFLADVQRQRLAGALERVAGRTEQPCRSVLVSGSGSFLARRLVVENARTGGAAVIALDECFSGEVAEAACAFTVARLAMERLL